MAAAAATSTATSIVTAACGVESLSCEKEGGLVACGVAAANATSTAACGVESLSCEKGKLVVCAVAANELVSAEMSVAWGFLER